MKIRVGFGFDVHQLAEGRDCVIGGVHIPHHKGPLGHSDADVLLHAVCDALLGAAGLRDIGFHFPDTDQAFRNINSMALMVQVMSLLKEEGYTIGNIDATVVLERPKINPHIADMQAAMAPILGIAPGDISIKATTNEQMGFIGREEGVAAYAVALIQRS